MRIIVSVLGMLVIVGLLGLAAWKVNEVGILWWEAGKFRNDVAKLKQMSVKGQFGSGCATDLVPENSTEGLQIRFTSPTHYVIEPACATPVEVEPLLENELAFGVERLYGPGILLTLDNSEGFGPDAWVHLTRNQKTVAVGLFDNQAEIKWQADDLVIGGDSPARAKCSDWGFFCCGSGNGQGQGMQVGAIDCVTNCYQSCNRAPEIVYFNSDPQVNPVNRTATLSAADSSVTFGYQVTDDSGTPVKIEIDFGDGETYQTSELKNSALSHEYSCPRGGCTFVATLTAEDEFGAASVESMASRIKIVMQP